ncbi:MAG: hypothetical protein PHX50_15115 [Massilibacteroides sp.]|nr:hypothetical protein [Massilibacteroides sp.]
MSKVITFSREFSKYHPKAGAPTYFKWKLLTAAYFLKLISYEQAIQNDLIDHEDRFLYIPKFTTIRRGYRWKEGDRFSPREWSGKPYCSKQNIICPDMTIETIYPFSYYPDQGFFMSGQRIDISKSLIPMNDGLTVEDFFNWFGQKKPFDGQLLSFKKGLHDEELKNIYKERVVDILGL